MNRLQRIIKQSIEQLRGLTVSQQLAVGLCGVVIVGAMAMLLRWSAGAPMVPLLQQPLTPEQLARLKAQLDIQGAAYEQRNNTVYVRRSDRNQLTYTLTAANAMPQDISMTIESLVKESNPWDSQQGLQKKWQAVMGFELQRIIASSPQIDSARVTLDRREKRLLGNAEPAVTASVFVTPKPGYEVDKQMTRALAMFVSSSVAGLKPHDVAVIDALSLKASRLPNAEDAESGELHDHQKMVETELLGKVKNLVQYIPHALVSVSVDLDTEMSETTDVKWGKPQIVDELRHNTTQTHSTGSAREPGVAANTEVRLNSAGGGTESLTEDQERIKYGEAKQDEKRTHVLKKHPKVKTAKASISIPLSFFVETYKNKPGNDPSKEPTEADLQPSMSEEFQKVRKLVQTIIMAQRETDVEVNYYNDAVSMTDAAAMEHPTDSGTIVGLLKGYGAQLGLGALAVFSLVMMMMMVRKSVPGPSLKERDAAGEDQRRGRGEEPRSALEELLAEARPSDGMLEGKEIDPIILRTTQLTQQIAAMIEDDPKSAASLVRRWVQDDRG